MTAFVVGAGPLLERIARDGGFKLMAAMWMQFLYSQNATEGRGREELQKCQPGHEADTVGQLVDP